MATLTYAEVLSRSSELAGIPRDVIGTTEQAMLKSFLAIHLRSIWRATIWPETRTVAQKTPTSRLIAKGATIDQVMKVTTDNPRSTTKWRRVEFWDNSTTIELYEDLTSVYVDYLAPCPDIGALDPAGLALLTITDRMAMPLMYKGAGSLCRALGKLDQGNELLRLGEAALAEEAAAFGRNLDD